jgi:hypothetical protein
VVDEAPASVGTHQGRQQRFELLNRLAEVSRNCVMSRAVTVLLLLLPKE